MRQAATLDQVQAAGGYRVILADPPWNYDQKVRKSLDEAHYATMTPAEVRALPVELLAAGNDFVIGSRALPGTRNPVPQPLLRRIVGRAGEASALGTGRVEVEQAVTHGQQKRAARQRCAAAGLGVKVPLAVQAAAGREH